MLGVIFVFLVMLVCLGFHSHIRSSNRHWRAPGFLDGRGRAASVLAILLVGSGFFPTLAGLGARRSISTLKLLQCTLELNNSLVKLRKVTANIGVYRNNVP